MGRLLPLLAAAAVLVALSFLRLRFNAEEFPASRSRDVTSLRNGSLPGTPMLVSFRSETTSPVGPVYFEKLTAEVPSELTIVEFQGTSSLHPQIPQSTEAPSLENHSLVLVTPKPDQTIRRYDFIFCANIVGTLGNALQALKAFLIIAKRMQERGWRILLQLPALGWGELDVTPLGSRNGTALSELFDLTPLRQHFDLEEVADASAELRRGSCSEESCDVSIWSLVQVRSLFLSNVEVPHLWMGPGKEKWMFEELFNNLGALSNERPTESFVSKPIRIYWEMQKFSPTRCAPWVYGDLERHIAQAMVPREPEEKETCAFIYVGHILHREGWWKLKSLNPWAFAAPDRLRADIPTVAGKIGQLLQEYQIGCANFYVKLLGLTGQNFVDLVHQGAAATGVNFTAKRLKKRNCRLCMKGNMEMLRRAAAAPLLVAEPDSFWPDVAATRLLERERPVAYIYAELLEKRRWDSWLERFVEPPPNITLRLLDCPWPNQVYRGSCIEPSDGAAVDTDGSYECWPDLK